MKRLVSTVDLPKEEWLRYRQKGITGSDAGSVVGMNPFKSAFEVYREKISEEVIEIPDNEAMRQGRDLEEYVAKRFEEETGLKVRRANAIYYNEEHPFMLADFDRLIVGKNAGLECKTVNTYGADKWTDDKIPLHYQLQVQHYLAVSGLDSWYIAALIFGKALIIHEIKRDEELIQGLIKIEERFWTENVMKRVMPDPDGSKSCSEEISKMYFKSDLDKTVNLLGFDSALNRRNEIQEIIEKLEREKQEIDQKIQLEMGDAAYASTGSYKISWLSTLSKRMDTKRFKAEHPDLYNSYLNESAARRFLVRRIA